MFLILLDILAWQYNSVNKFSFQRYAMSGDCEMTMSSCTDGTEGSQDEVKKADFFSEYNWSFDSFKFFDHIG